MNSELHKAVPRTAILSPLALIAVLALALALGGCGGAGESAQAQDPFMGGSDRGAPYDLRFIDEMTMHHAGAIMSSEAMISRSARPQLRDLNRRIQISQKRQIEQMRAWRKAWYPRAAAAPMGGMNMTGMMGADGEMGMMGGRATGGPGEDRMSGDRGGRMPMQMGGDRADRMFLRMMIPHHQLAVEMSEDALDNAEHEELKDLAREIIKGQTAEIAEMERYLKDWYGDESTRALAGPMREMMQGTMGGMGRP